MIHLLLEFYKIPILQHSMLVIDHKLKHKTQTTMHNLHTNHLSHNQSKNLNHSLFFLFFFKIKIENIIQYKYNIVYYILYNKLTILHRIHFVQVLIIWKILHLKRKN